MAGPGQNSLFLRRRLVKNFGGISEIPVINQSLSAIFNQIKVIFFRGHDAVRKLLHLYHLVFRRL
jgi:hypothetical protein